MTPRARLRGFTLVEIAFVVGLVSVAVGAVGGIFRTSSGVADDSRATLRVHEQHRRNLEAIARVLRGADLETFHGFSPAGAATSLRFERVTGAGNGGVTTSGPEELRWVPVGKAPGGADEPGRVIHVTGGVPVVVAERVPGGGFEVRQEGGNLVIRLTTSYRTPEGRTSLISGETAVFVRN